MSINDIIEFKPDHILVSDSQTFGLGGFSMTKGYAWIFFTTNELMGKSANKFLEWPAKVVTLKIEMHFGNVLPGCFMLPVGDGASSLSWLCR